MAVVVVVVGIEDGAAVVDALDGKFDAGVNGKLGNPNLKYIRK